jgi:hypothetical protein
VLRRKARRTTLNGGSVNTPRNPKAPGEAHLEYLVEHVGPRPAASPAGHQAEAYIRDVFTANGLAVEDVRLGFPNWSLVDAALTLKGDPLELDVNPFSPPCDVTAPVVALSTLPQLEAANLNGRIALLYGHLSKDPVFPMNFELVQFERDQAINRLLIEKAPAAVLAVNLNPWRRVHIFEDEDFPIPSATLSTEVGRRLLTEQGHTAHLTIRSTTAPGHVTTLIGRTPPAHTHAIVICAHYDTKVGTPGAFDNGSGAAVLLALAESLPKAGLSVDLEFIAWGDEEYGAHTDMAYVRQHGDRFDDLICAINVDGVGPLMENTTLTMLAHSPAFEERVRAVHAGHPGVVWVDPWVQSNHSTFALHGVPSIALSTLTWERAHQADDSMQWIGPEKLAEAIALVTELVEEIQRHPASWSRP